MADVHARNAAQSLWVKICGITNADDALAAREFGADAIGLNCFRGSKRYVDLQQASDWITALPAALTKVAILVDAPFEDAISIARLPFIDALQLHGHETPEFCSQLAAAGVRFSKALAVTEKTLPGSGAIFHTDTIVLDSISRGKFGGTGKAFPWHLARQFAESQPQLRIILAGGLTPENVEAAVRDVRPFGVDVTSGVEGTPGRKDHRALRRFIEAARRA